MSNIKNKFLRFMVLVLLLTCTVISPITATKAYAASSSHNFSVSITDANKGDVFKAKMLGAVSCNKNGISITGQYCVHGSSNASCKIRYYVYSGQGKIIYTHDHVYSPGDDACSMILENFDLGSYKGTATVYASKISGSGTVTLDGVLRQQ